MFSDQNFNIADQHAGTRLARTFAEEGDGNDPAPAEPGIDIPHWHNQLLFTFRVFVTV